MSLVPLRIPMGVICLSKSARLAALITMSRTPQSYNQFPLELFIPKVAVVNWKHKLAKAANIWVK